MLARASNLPKVTLRPLALADFHYLVKWINEPHVARWWDGTTDSEAVNAKYGPRLEADSPTSVFVIEVDNCPAGIIQCYRHKDYPDWDRAVGIENGAGIDYLIGETAFIGKGLGAQAIREIAKIAFNLYPEITVVLAAPERDNHASWRTLEKAGFERVDERQLESGCPSDAWVSYIYALRRDKR